MLNVAPNVEKYFFDAEWRKTKVAMKGNEFKILYKEDKRTQNSREEEIGANGNAQKKLRLREQGQVTQQNNARVRSELPVTSDEDEQHDALCKGYLLGAREETRKRSTLAIDEKVLRGAQHNWI